MKAESRKEALRYFYAKVVDPLGYKFSPDTELVEFLLDQEVALEQQLESPFCPDALRNVYHGSQHGRAPLMIDP